MQVSVTIQVTAAQKEKFWTPFRSYTTFASMNAEGDVHHDNVLICMAIQNLVWTLRQEGGLEVKP